MKRRDRRFVLLLAFLACGCQQKMASHGRLRPYSSEERAPVEGTVASGTLELDPVFFQGKVNGAPVKDIPVPVNGELLRRGHERFNIYCSPCHGETGDGRGMIVQRGLKQPPSYHQERLRTAPAGHFFDVITHGFATMYSYSDRVEAGDRWAIIAYIRALQLSQNTKISALTPSERKKLEGP